MKDIIAALRTITCNVAQCPYGLLTDVEHRGGQKVNEFRNRASIYDHLSVVSGTRSNVSQSPCSLKLVR